jgi:phage-related protein
MTSGERCWLKLKAMRMQKVQVSNTMRLARLANTKGRVRRNQWKRRKNLRRASIQSLLVRRLLVRRHL